MMRGMRFSYMYIVLMKRIYFLRCLDVMYIIPVIVHSFLLRFTYKISFDSLDSPQKCWILMQIL